MTELHEILLSLQNRSSRNTHPWKTQALQPAEVSSFCKWLPRTLIWYEGHLWASSWTSPASKIQGKELQPAGDASVQPCRLQKNAHLEPTTGVCFYYQNRNSRTTEHKSIDYFHFQTDASSGLSPQKWLFQVPAALGFYLIKIFILSTAEDKQGKGSLISPSQQGKAWWQNPIVPACSSHWAWHRVDMHQHPSHCCQHSLWSKPRNLPTLQEPRQHFTAFLLLLDFAAFRYHCVAILSWKVFSLILTMAKCSFVFAH